MKRIVCLFLSLSFLLAFAACAGQRGSEANAATPEPTAPPPAENVALFPDAAMFCEITGFDPDTPYGDGAFGSTCILRAESAFDAAQKPLGYVIVLENRDAYNPPLTLALGIKPGGMTAGIVFIALNETPGKGSLADDPAFRDQFADRRVGSFLLNGTGEDAVDAITGATWTSKAVVNAVNAGLDFYRTVIRP